MKLYTNRKLAFVFVLGLVWGLDSANAYAGIFGSGANIFEIEFVTIGDPGNPADELPNPAGAVNYGYRLGKYEVPEDAIRKANAASAAAGEPLGITLDERGADKPATSVTWFEAAKFVNWLNTSTGHTPAYKFDDQEAFQLWEPSDPGYNANNLFRNRRAFYFLPSIDEWHKAAYYDPVKDLYFDYPTGSDSVPDGIDFVGDTEFDAVFFDGAANDGPNYINDVGLLSPFATAGQGGIFLNGRKRHSTASIMLLTSNVVRQAAPGNRRILYLKHQIHLEVRRLHMRDCLLVFALHRFLSLRVVCW